MHVNEMIPLSKTIVIIPTYNERENIVDIVTRTRIAAPEVSVLVADDGSPDGTGYLADELAATDSHVHVIHRTAKDGLGAAYLYSFDWAIKHGYTTLVQMDADGSHLPEQLPSLLEASAAGADVVIGSRWVTGGKVVNWPWYRFIVSRGGSLYTRIMLGVPVEDATAGYRVYTSSALERIGLDSINTKGYGFQVDMLWRAYRNGLRITEVPVTFVERERGQSKMSSGIVFEAMFNVTRWALRDRWGIGGNAS